MNPEQDKRQRNETTFFVFCALIGLVGVWLWTESVGAVLTLFGLATLIGECTSAITRRLDAIIGKERVL